jgi:hypothetical protein
MALFQTDPAKALHAEQAALVAAERRLAELLVERAAKIEQADGDNYLDDVAKLDAEVGKLGKVVATRRERITVLEAKARAAVAAMAAKARASEVAAIGQRLTARTAAAAELEQGLKIVAGAFEKMERADTAVFANWTDELPPSHRFSYLSAMRIIELSATRKTRMTAGLIRELVKRAPLGIAAEVEKRNRELVDELNAAIKPPVEPEASEDTAA